MTLRCWLEAGDTIFEEKENHTHHVFGYHDVLEKPIMNEGLGTVAMVGFSGGGIHALELELLTVKRGPKG